MIEKRKHPRIPLQISMDIHARGQTVGKCQGRISNLSVGGMALKTNAELEQGMTLYLKLNIPLEIRGEVRHIKGATPGAMRSYGVRFHKIGIPDPSKPEHFIAAKFSKPKE